MEHSTDDDADRYRSALHKNQYFGLGIYPSSPLHSFSIVSIYSEKNRRSTGYLWHDQNVNHDVPPFPGRGKKVGGHSLHEIVIDINANVIGDFFRNSRPTEMWVAQL